MRNLELSKRLKRLPPYLFAEIDEAKTKLKKKGIKLIDLSIGDPDIKAPKEVIKSLHKASKIKDNQQYDSSRGKESLRKEIRKWMKKRFKVSLDQDKEILPLIGTKEGLVHLPLGFVNSGDYVLLPNPGYPGYRGAVVLSEGKAYDIPLLEENKFLPDLKKIPLSVRNKSKFIYLNYPNNPTTAMASKKFLQDLVYFCKKYGIVIVYDNAYSELYYNKKPYSIMEVKGAKEVAVEFHSFSKTFCMTGFRLGWVCGNENIINGLVKVKSNIDSGIFGAVQDAGVTALTSCSYFVRELRKTIKQRKDILVDILKDSGFKDINCDSTFYIWARIPERFSSSIEFAEYLMKEKNIVATPGVGFGKFGEGYIRFALTVDQNTLKKTKKLFR